jgi:hypothetical protein
MAFPTPASTRANGVAVSGSDFTFGAMPAGTTAGDLLVAYGHTTEDNADYTDPSGWTRKDSEPGNTGRSFVWARVATGTDPLVFPLSALANSIGIIVARITGWTGTDTASVEANLLADFSGAGDPPSITATWGSADNTFIAVCGREGSDITTFPTGYTGGVSGISPGNWGAVAMAFKESASATDNPGTGFSTGGSTVHVGTIVVRGSVAADTAAPSITSTGTGATNGPFAVNVGENSAAVAITLTSDEALGSVTKGGADGALFTLAGSGLTRTLAPTAAFDFESLPHANPFVVTLTFADTATPTPNERTVTVNFTVTNVSEAPLAPTIGTATAGNATAGVAFTPPTNTGRPAITGYAATSSPGGLTGTGASSPITVSGLTNGTTYTFTVTATNSEGTGPASAASNPVTPSASGTAPSISSQPANQTVTAGATATFSVAATGTGTFAYQWRRNGSNISGATSASYTTPATTVSGGSANNGDLYSVVVTGDTAPTATSNNATLTVNAPGAATYIAQTDVIAVSGIPLASTLVYYTWCPAGRPGSITAPVNSTTTTDASGRATIAHTVAGDGFVIIGTRPGPVVANDRVFGQFLTLA